MPLAWTLAWRYASRRAVNYVAVAAIALALTVQIVASGIVDGQILEMENRVQKLGQHITVTFVPGKRTPQGYIDNRPDNPSPYWDLPSAPDFDRLARAVEAVPGVRGAAPTLRHEAAVHAKDGFAAGYVIAVGVDLARELANSRLGEFVTNFRPDPAAPSWFPPDFDRALRDRPAAWIGRHLAQQLGVEPGDEIRLVYRDPALPADAEVGSVAYRVAGILKSDWYEIDKYNVYVPLETAMPLFYPRYRDDPGRVPGFGVWLDVPWEADKELPAVEDAMARTLPAAQFTASTWIERWRDVAEGMMHENRMVELVLALFTLSTGFCVFAILSTLVSRRLRDMGLLRCLGARRRSVLAAFLLVGLWIGAAGAALGTAGGLWLLSPVPRAADAPPDEAPTVWVAVAYKAITGETMYSPRMYGSRVPIFVDGRKVAAYAAGAVLVAMLAGLYPACWAASREPAGVLAEQG